MKILTSILSLTLVAVAFGQKEGKPERCVDDEMFEWDDVGKREALCNGSDDRYRLGINEYRRFAIWDGDKMEELFAKQGDDLSIKEDDDGKRVALTLRDKYGDIMWQIKCSGLTGSAWTRLEVRDSSSRTVVLRQGDVDLWTVDSNGNEDLSRRCEYDTGDEGDRCDDKDNWVYYEDKKKDECYEYCINDDDEKLMVEVDCKKDDRCDDKDNWVYYEDKKNDKCWEYCFDDDGEKLSVEVDCKKDDRCDDKDNWVYYEDKQNDKCYEYCFDDDGKKVWEEVDCKDDGDRCDKDSNWEVKWDGDKKECYEWCKDDDNDILTRPVADSKCNTCDSDGPWDYAWYEGKCYAYCFNTPSGEKDSKVVDDDKCDDEPSGGDYFLAINKASLGDLCIKGSSRTRLRPCSTADSKQLWELTKDGELVTKKQPKGCLYVDDNAMGEIARYDDDCSSSKHHSKWRVTGSNQIQLKTDEDYCLTYDAPTWIDPDNKDLMVIRYCRDIDRFEYDFYEK